MFATAQLTFSALFILNTVLSVIVLHFLINIFNILFKKYDFYFMVRLKKKMFDGNGTLCTCTVAPPLWIFLLLGIASALVGCVGCGCGWSRGCGLCPN
jgi:hypothetical protein